MCTSQDQCIFWMFCRWLTVLGVLGAGEMLGTTYFAMCITFFVNENHVAQLAPKMLSVHTAQLPLVHFGNLFTQLQAALVLVSQVSHTLPVCVCLSTQPQHTVHHCISQSHQISLLPLVCYTTDVSLVSQISFSPLVCHTMIMYRIKK